MNRKRCIRCEIPVTPTDGDTCPFCSQSLANCPQLDEAALADLSRRAVTPAVSNHEQPEGGGGYRKAGFFLAIVIGVYCHKILGHGWWFSYGIAVVLGITLPFLFGSMRGAPDTRSVRAHLIGIAGIAASIGLAYATDDDYMFMAAVLAATISFVVQLTTHHNAYSLLAGCLGGVPATTLAWWTAHGSRYGHGLKGGEWLLVVFLTLCQCIPAAVLIWLRKKLVEQPPA